MVQAKHKDTGGDPANRLVLDDDQMYYGRFTFRFTVSPSGVVQGRGKGEYAEASWTLSGRNGDKGSISCSPELTAAPFKVQVSGSVSTSGAIDLDLFLVNAEESSVDTPCGGDFTAFGSTTQKLKDSLATVGGDAVVFRKGQYSRNLSKHQETHVGDDDLLRDDDWTITIEQGKRFTPEEKEQFGRAAAELGLTAASLGSVGAVCAFVPEPVVTKACAGVFGIGAIVVGLPAAHLAYLASDPPDRRYRKIAKPAPVRPPAVTGEDGVSQEAASALNALFRKQARAAALGQALLTSIERAQGAANARAKTWERRQARAARGYASQLAATLSAEIPLLSRARAALEGSGFPSVPVTAEGVRALQRSIAQAGLPEKLARAARRLKIGKRMRAGLELTLRAANADNVSQRGAFPALLDHPSHIAALRVAAKRLRAFAK